MWILITISMFLGAEIGAPPDFVYTTGVVKSVYTTEEACKLSESQAIGSPNFTVVVPCTFDEAVTATTPDFPTDEQK